MKDTKEKENSSKFSDLFEELQETLDNSIFNSTGQTGNSISESETVSELFDALNRKTSDDLLADTKDMINDMLSEIIPGEIKEIKTEPLKTPEPAGEKIKRSPLDSFMSSQQPHRNRNRDYDYDAAAERT